MKHVNPNIAWDKEYSRPDFVTKSPEPQADFLRFLKWAKKAKFPLMDARVIDAGCGTGRNALYMAEQYDAHVSAFDFSREAIRIASTEFAHPHVSFSVRSMTEQFPEENSCVDMALDIMASLSLGARELDQFIKELARVVRPGGLLYLRTLAKEGDKNAAYLMKHNPGAEADTYIHPTLGSSERVSTESQIREHYAPFFEILFMEKKSGYQKFGNQSYKRNYWNVYLKRHA